MGFYPQGLGLLGRLQLLHISTPRYAAQLFNLGHRPIQALRNTTCDWLQYNILVSDIKANLYTGAIFTPLDLLFS
jgi:hypothetical protein